MSASELWERMTAEERVVMITALEEAFLNGVIADYLGTTSMNGAVHIFSNDADAIRAEIPRFRLIVLDLIDRKLIEIRETPDLDWDAAAPMTREEILAVLADPDAWLWTDGEAKRMIMLMTTDEADILLQWVR